VRARRRRRLKRNCVGRIAGGGDCFDQEWSVKVKLQVCKPGTLITRETDRLVAGGEIRQKSLR
jgi:hypothetical protein